MEIFPVFYKKILKAFEKYNLRYLIIGGYATTFHGVIRSTLDLDLWVDSKKDNREKLFKSLNSLEYSENSCRQAVEAFKKDHMIKIPYKVDLIEIMDDFITKMDFDTAYKNRIEQKDSNLTFHVIGIQDLITMKLKTNRYRDLIDAKELKEISDEKNSF